MLLHVLHETAYDYVPMVRTAQHIAHLKPTTTARQQVLHHRLTVEPRPRQQSEALDVFGNTRTFFSLPYPHDALRVEADSLVETRPQVEPAASLPWDAVAEAMRYHRGARYDPAAEFSFPSPYVPRDAAFAAYAQASFAAGRPLLEAARDLMRRVHADFEYETTATDVNTPALEALALRKGVCQDLAHVMIGCLRSLGLPARYVSGYLLTEPPPGQPRLVGSDASHAWVAVYLPEPEADAPPAAGPAAPASAARGTWFELDPTNDRDAGDDYVTLAIGRDFSDVSPIRGVIHGGSNHSLRVAVTVTPTAPAAQP